MRPNTIMRAGVDETISRPVLAPAPDTGRGSPRILVVEPDVARREQVARGLAALGYRADCCGQVEEVACDSPGQWALVLTGEHLSAPELAELHRRLQAVGPAPPAVRSLAAVFADPLGGVGQTDVAAAGEGGSNGSSVWSEESKVRLLAWVADAGSVVLRPSPCPHAPLGHAYPSLEKHCSIRPGEAVRLLEDLADFGVLARRLANRVHLCPNCRHWTINFRETCPTCSSLDVGIEGLIHHFACAYVGLDSEYRSGHALQCPKCRGQLKHIGVDYERPRQTYVCATCQALFEDPLVTAQCLDCAWQGSAADVLAWPVYEYDLTARGREAVERGELRGLKLREMIRSGRFELAAREFFELEVERETYRLQRYGRAMSILVCRFEVDGQPYALFRETDRRTVQEFARRVTGLMRAIDVAALADARTLALLLPETDENQAGGALAKLEKGLNEIELGSPDGRPVQRRWVRRSWSQKPGQPDEAMRWFQQQMDS